MSSDISSALLYLPITDPTSPYHSLTYLDSYAQQHGHRPAEIIDANIEAFHHSYTDAAVARLRAELAQLDPADFAGFLPEAEVRASLLRVGEPDPEAVREAVATLQDPVRFYDYDRYQQAVDAIEAWMNCVGAVGFPGQFRGGFQLGPIRQLMVGSSATLTDPAVLARLSRPFQDYYDEVLLPRLAAARHDVIGLNVTYVWQLPFALWLAQLIRRELPEVFLLAGGTEVSDVWKYALDKKTAFEVFDAFDAIVVGEGERAWVDVLQARAEQELPTQNPNVRLHPRYGARRSLDLLHYEPLAELPTPDFSGIDWSLYLSPEPFVYYSPTRGCYWNKCTFCDYGLNTTGPTSPWRKSPADRMIDDVREISRHARFIYFSVDVLAPATMLEFAERVVAEGIDIRWGAEIRLEKYWSPERCALLRASGCVAVSVGFESGNQRILDLIDKGTRPEQVERTITALHDAGIAVQMMGFTGFPTETAAEAADSVDFLADHRDLWTFGGLGDFGLTSGAIVAKQPERFGVSDIAPPPGSDIPRALYYVEPISQAAQAEVADYKRQRLDNAPNDRPWLGGTDTPHSFYYHDRFGTSVRDVLTGARRVRAGDQNREFVLNGSVIDAPDDATMQTYLSLYAPGQNRATTEKVLFRRADGALLLLPKSTAGLFTLFRDPTTLAQASQQLWMLDELTAARAWNVLLGCGALRRSGDRPGPAVPEPTRSRSLNRRLA